MGSALSAYVSDGLTWYRGNCPPRPAPADVSAAVRITRQSVNDVL